jgi:hypothetical protein
MARCNGGNRYRKTTLVPAQGRFFATDFGIANPSHYVNACRSLTHFLSTLNLIPNTNVIDGFQKSLF